MDITKINVLLFQGDSITDVSRNRMAVGPNSQDALGFGYPRMIADRIKSKNYDHLAIYNRGISGDQIKDLVYRWDRDSIQLQPDLISILIGVNDTWNYLYMGMGTSPDEYRVVYEDLLRETRSKLPGVQLVLCEPFILLTGEVSLEWVEDLVLRQTAVQELAQEYNGVFVPFQSALNEAASQVPSSQLLDDGVHPTEQGHQVLADCWIEAVLS